MGHIQVVALSVVGSDEVLREAMSTAMQVINQSLNNGDPGQRTIAAAPAAPALPAPAVRAPKKPRKNKAAEKTESAAGGLWCPVKNCGRQFRIKGWLNNHLEKDHGIRDTI
jgi:hypothetical protein